MRSLRFLSPAETEMVAAACYYESQSPGLGHRFLQETERLATAIAGHPHAGPILRGDIRRRLMARFPFALIYGVTQEEIVIIAVMDLRRRPDYWVDRL